MPISDETRARQRAAKLGRTYGPEHRSSISAGLRRYWQAPRGIFGALSAAERADYRLLKRRHYSRAAALRAIGRPDLIPKHHQGDAR